MQTVNQMYMKTSVTILFLFALTSCATYSLAPQTISGFSENNTILIGSFSRRPWDRKYHGQSFFFKNSVTGRKYRISASNSFGFLGVTPVDFKEFDTHGGIFLRELPPGDYEFYNFILVQSSGTYTKSFESKEDFSIPFTVEANKLNYIGQIKLFVLTGRNIFGMILNNGGYWEVSDQIERDLPIVKDKYPTLQNSDVISIIPTIKTIPTPLVILPNEMEYLEELKETP